jgi:hypothetical protein
MTLMRSVLLLLVAVSIYGCKKNESTEAHHETAPDCTLVVEPARPLVIQSGSHRLSVFERDRYFRTYHFPGLYPAEQNAELHALGALPGRGTGPNFSAADNPLTQPSSVETVERILERWQQYSQAAQKEFPGLVYAMAGRGMPRGWGPAEYVESDDVDSTMKVGKTLAVAPEYYTDAAGLIVDWMQAIREVSGLPPLYYSAVNEPDSSWKLSEDRVGTFISYQRALAKVLKQQWPELKLTGPCTAWGYPKADFSRWENGWEGRFIDEAGDTVDAYDFHFYSKGYWAFTDDDRGWSPALQQDSPSLFASRRSGVGTVWDFGRLDAFLDMLASRHLLRWGGEAPAVIVSEFGRQGISKQLGPWENDFKYLLYMNTVVRMWMTFFDRPEIELTVPFILPQSDLGYGSMRGQAMYTRPGYPEDTSLVATPFVPFYGFFKGLKGTRVASHWEDASGYPGVQTLSLCEGKRLYVLIHNANPFGTEVTMGIRIPGTSQLVSSQSIRWDGPLPQRVDHAPQGRLIIGEMKVAPSQVGGLTTFSMHGEETLLLTWTVPDQESDAQALTRSWVYTPIALQKLEPGEWLELDVPEEVVSGDGAKQLVLGVARESGFEKGLNVEGGDGESWRRQVDLSSTQGITNYHDTVSVLLPASAVGSVRVALEEGGIISSAKWVIDR